MNTVDRIIYATQNLLSVLEQKLIYLRTKHRETLEFLAKVKQDHEEHLQKQVEKAIILNTNEILRAISASIEHKNLSIKFQRMESKSSTHHEEDCWKRRRQYSSGSRLSHFAHFRSKSTHELREFDTNLVLSNDSMDFKREPAQHFTPQVMGTQLLKINVGKSECSAATPFIACEATIQRSKTTNRSRTTSVSSYSRIKDQSYIEEDSMKTKSTRFLLPVPVSTYVVPIIPKYRRAKSANKRAVEMLVKASTPPGLKEHKIRTNISSQLRHLHCKYDKTHKRDPPGFPHS